ncbi:hypothetical protein [Micromonospora sp. WMMC250]|uniref:hypothetical protein n=1 Tax=Micromonospora sp. WMMC250 TaxID=3014781 RepID=UPI0022B61288|nr:hypothetical protein [Micromonospora sp. WMMC250]MCZ7375088.1 hypothetical protein [Micromonospora sp. WMMC250]
MSRPRPRPATIRGIATATPIVGRADHSLTYAVLGWAVAYGGVRLTWTVGDVPEFGQFD